MPALPPNASTVLVISAIGLPLYSARGLHQTLNALSIGATPRRTVNGKLVSLSPPQFEKYHTQISGSDQEPPSIDGVFIGARITIECIVELGTTGAPRRPVAAGSLRIDGSFTFYRPVLDMIVTALSTDSAEWDATVGWSLDAEEI